ELWKFVVELQVIGNDDANRSCHRFRDVTWRQRWPKSLLRLLRSNKNEASRPSIRARWTLLCYVIKLTEGTTFAEDLCGPTISARRLVSLKSYRSLLPGRDSVLRPALGTREISCGIAANTQLQRRRVGSGDVSKKNVLRSLLWIWSYRR